MFCVLCNLGIVNKGKSDIDGKSEQGRYFFNYICMAMHSTHFLNGEWPTRAGCDDDEKARQGAFDAHQKECAQLSEDGEIEFNHWKLYQKRASPKLTGGERRAEFDAAEKRLKERKHGGKRRAVAPSAPKKAKRARGDGSDDDDS